MGSGYVRWWGLTIVIVGLCTAVYGDIADFPYKKLVITQDADFKVGRLVLDAEVRRELSDDGSNVAVYNAEGRPVPHIVRAIGRRRISIEKERVNLKLKRVDWLEKDMLEFVFKRFITMPAPNRVIFSTRKQSFSRQITVFGSYYPKGWKVLAEKIQIIDRSTSKKISTGQHRL